MKKIRKTVKNDADKIAQIEYLSGYKWKMSKKEELREAEKILNSRNKLAYILQNYSKDIGYFVLSFKDRVCEIEFFSVIKSSQDKGLGSIMMKKLISIAKKKNCKRIKLAVWAKNFPAIGLYNKFGFFIIKIKQKHYPNGDDKIAMIKIID